jgi:hypothetical protein
MPRDSSGNYTLPPGNPVVGGTTITTAWANPTMADIGTELTNSLDRSGRGGMLAPFKFADGTLGAPGITWNAEPTSGIFRAGGNDMQAVIAGVPRMRWTASSVDVWDTGSSTWLSIVSGSGSTYALTGGNNNFTGTNTFTQPAYFTYVGTSTGNLAAVVLQSTQPNMLFRDTDAAANAKVWRLVGSGNSWQLNALSDDGVTASIGLNFTRSAVAFTNIAFGNATDNPTYSLLGTGLTTLGGALTVSGTGLSTFGGALNVNGDHVRVANTDVYFEWNETDAAADTKIWWARHSSGVWSLQTRTDAGGAGTAAFAITRAATAVASLVFGNPTDNPTFSFLGTGATAFGGNVTVAGITTHTGVIRAPDGTAAAPGYTWTGNTDTGFYRAAANRFEVTCQGIPRVRFSELNMALAITGTAVAGNCYMGFYENQAFVTRKGYLGYGNVGDDVFLINNEKNAAMVFATNAVVRVTIDGAGATIVSTPQWRGQDGSSSAPAFSFSSDPNTGVYNNSADVIGFATGGAAAGSWNLNGVLSIGDGKANGDRIQIRNLTAVSGANYHHYFNLQSATTLRLYGYDGTVTTVGIFDIRHSQVQFADGAVGAPVLSFNADTDTGIYRIGADVLGIAIGGVNVAAFNTSANGSLRITDFAGSFQDVGYRGVPRSATTTTLVKNDIGKCVPITATIAVPVSVFAAGDALSVYNDSAGNLTITCTSATLRLAGTTTIGGTRTLAPRAMATLWFNTGGATPDVIVGGPGVS